MIKIKRANITIPESLYKEALERMEKEHFGSFSEFIAYLIRQHVSERAALAALKQTGHKIREATAPLAAEEKADYKATKAG